MAIYVSYAVVSARIRRELYEKLKRYGIPVSEVVRRVLEEVGRREEMEIREALARAQGILKRIPPEELVEAVRASREER